MYMWYDSIYNIPEKEKVTNDDEQIMFTSVEGKAIN